MSADCIRLSIIVRREEKQTNWRDTCRMLLHQVFFSDLHHATHSETVQALLGCLFRCRQVGTKALGQRFQ